MKSFRKIIFWLHLISGCLAGVIIAVLCLTGALLVYEGNIESMLKPTVAVQPASVHRLTLDEILDKLKARGQGDVFEFVVHNGDNQPVEARWGHTKSVYLDPWTAEVVPQGKADFAHNIFWISEQLHVGLGQSKRTGIVGPFLVHSATLLCLILFISGVYLWLPNVFSKPAFKARFFFKKGLTGRPRDLNWHNVFGIWTTIPMLVILITGLVWSYPWAQKIVYSAFGVKMQQRGAGHAAAPAAPVADIAGAPVAAGGHGGAAAAPKSAPAAGGHADAAPRESARVEEPAARGEGRGSRDEAAGAAPAGGHGGEGRGEGRGGRDQAAGAAPAGGHGGEGRGEGRGGRDAEGGRAPREEAAAPAAVAEKPAHAAPVAKPAVVAAKKVETPVAPAPVAAAPALLPLEQLSNITKGLTSDWSFFSMPIPKNGISDEPEEVMIFAKTKFYEGGPEGMTRIELDYHDGRVAKFTPFMQRDMSLKLHAWMKSFHTLSEFGPIGQIIAAITCLAGFMLVWTGYALSIRRYLNWRKRRKAAAQAA